MVLPIAVRRITGQIRWWQEELQCRHQFFGTRIIDENYGDNGFDCHSRNPTIVAKREVCPIGTAVDRIIITGSAISRFSLILVDILITRLHWRPKLRMPASGFERNRHEVWPGVTEGLSEGSRATAPNSPFGQQPFIVGHCCWLLFAVLSFC